MKTVAASIWRAIAILLLAAVWCAAQQSASSVSGHKTKPESIHVNWLYGAYLPRDADLQPLTSDERAQLYLRQTYTTWGIYAKTAFFSLGDQAHNSPDQWGGGLEGFGRRFASRYGEFAIQNTFSSAGNYVLGNEPRYDVCRCSGAWLRIRHALSRNFVTYKSTEHGERPQFALYAGAMGAGMIASSWKPGPRATWRAGYQSVLTQAAFGCLSNLVAEFAPDIKAKLKK